MSSSANSFTAKHERNCFENGNGNQTTTRVSSTESTLPEQMITSTERVRRTEYEFCDLSNRKSEEANSPAANGRHGPKAGEQNKSALIWHGVYGCSLVPEADDQQDGPTHGWDGKDGSTTLDGTAR